MSDNGLKVPSLVFRWFERMKTNYENSIQSTLKNFENFANKQQERVDSANKSHLEDLKHNHQQQLIQQQQTIDSLSNEVEYYKQQISHQQQTIDQLSSRYDAAVNMLISGNTNNTIKDIYDKEEPLSIAENAPLTINDNPTTVKQEKIYAPESEKAHHQVISDDIDIKDDTEDESLTSELPTTEEIYQEAMTLRGEGEHVIAYHLFEQAAEQGHAKALGALARAYFLSEGVEEDQVKGLSYLIEAAEIGLEQVIIKVEHYKTHNPELFFEAQQLNKNEAFA